MLQQLTVLVVRGPNLNPVLEVGRNVFVFARCD